MIIDTVITVEIHRENAWQDEEYRSELSREHELVEQRIRDAVAELANDLHYRAGYTYKFEVK